MLVWYLAAWELPAALLLPVKVRRESSGRIRPRPRALLPLRRPAMRSPPAPVQPLSGPGGARGVPPCRVSHALHPPAPGLCLRPRRRDGRGLVAQVKIILKERFWLSRTAEPGRAGFAPRLGSSASPSGSCVPPESPAGSQQKASGLETGPLRPRHRTAGPGRCVPLLPALPSVGITRHPRRQWSRRSCRHPGSDPGPRPAAQPLRGHPRNRHTHTSAGGPCPAAELPPARPPQPVPAQGAGKEEHDKFGGNLRILLERKGLPYLEPGSPLLPLIKKKKK